MTIDDRELGLRRTTGGLFVVGALAFRAAVTALSATFDWPDVLADCR